MDELDEVLDIQQRQKRAMIIRRYKTKIERAKEVAKSKMAPDKTIKKRAYAQARQIVRKRYAGQRGAEYEKLGPSEKMAIDRAIEKKQALIKKIALRLIPKVKQAEAKRLGTFMHGKSLENHGQPEGNTKVNEEFSSFFAEKYDDLSANRLPDENKTQEVKKAKKGKGNNQIKFYNKFGEEVSISRPAYEALEKKAEKSGIDIDILGEVYNRGRDAWTGGKVTQEQYAFARVNSFINQGRSYFEEDADLHGEELVEKRGLWDNIHAKRKRIKAGSGERMRKPGSKGAPTAQNFRDAQESVQIDELSAMTVNAARRGIEKKVGLDPRMDPAKKEKHLASFKTGTHKILGIAKVNATEEVLDEAQKFGKHIGTVNGYHIHDLGANTPHKQKRFLAYANHYGWISHSAPTKAEITKKSKERDKSETPKPKSKAEQEHDDWRAEQKHRLQSGEVRRAVRGFREEAEINEMDGDQHYGDTRGAASGGANGTPISKEKMKKDASKTLNQMFQKVMNKEEAEAPGTKIRKKIEVVDRAPKTPGVYTKQAEIKNKIIDEEHPNCGTPECCGQCESVGNSQNDPAKRLVGTDSLVKAFKKDTPGQDGDLNESFNIAFAAGVGVSLTAADLGMKAQGGFQLHPSVIAEMQAREEEIEEDVASAVKKPVYVPPIRREDGTYTPAKTVMRKTNKKIIKGDGSSHDGN